MFIRVTFYCSNIKEAHKEHSQRDKWPAPFIMLLLLLLLLLWFQFDAAAAAPTAVFGWANEALTQDAFIAMVIFKIVMSLQRARLWYGKAIKFRWWFFPLSFVIWMWLWLALDLALAICSVWVFHCSVCVCIWLHFVQLVMVHDLSSVNIKSVTFLYIFMAFYSFKNSMNFLFSRSFETNQMCAQWYGGLYSIWLESHIAVFIRIRKILLDAGIARIASSAPNIPQHLLFFCAKTFYRRPPQRSLLLSVAMCDVLSNWSLFQQCLMQ